MGIFASIARKNEEEAKDRRLQSETKKNESETKRLEAEAKLVKIKSEQERETMKLQASIQEKVRAAEEKAKAAQEKRDEERDKKLREEQKQMEERLRQEQTQMQERLRQEILPLINNLQRQVAELRQEISESKQDNAIKSRILVGLQASIRDLLANNQSFESKLACLVTDVQLIREDFQGHFDSIGDQLSLLNNEMQQMQSEENRVPALENIPMLEMQQI